MTDIEDITRRFNAERARGGTVHSAAQIPMSFEQLTAAWFTEALAGNVPGAAVTQIRLGDPDDGSTNRRRVFLEYNGAGRRAGLPGTVFCKGALALSNRIHLGLAKGAETEVNFFKHLQPQLEIPAPKALFTNYDDASWAYIVILEDMTGQVTFCDEYTDVSRDMAVSQMDHLARFHSWSARRLPHQPFGEWFLPWPDLWRCILRLDLEKACGNGFIAAERVVPARLFRRRAEIWSCTMESVARHDRLPRMLMHNEVHLKNWYMFADGRMALGDWQSMAIGNWCRDFAYTVSTSLTIEKRRAWEYDLLRIYLEKQREHGMPALSFDDAWMLYRQQLFMALAFWTPTLAPSDKQVASQQPRDASLIFVERIATAIDDLDALDSFGD